MQVEPGLRGSVGRGDERDLTLVVPAAGGRGPGTPGEAVGDGVKPARQGPAPVQRRGLAGEDEEGGLEGVLGVLLLAQHPPAHAQHQRPVAPHQLRKRLAVPVVCVPFEEPAIPRLRALSGADQPAEVPQNGSQGSRRHGPALPGMLPLPENRPRRPGQIRNSGKTRSARP